MMAKSKIEVVPANRFFDSKTTAMGKEKRKKQISCGVRRLRSRLPGWAHSAVGPEPKVWNLRFRT